MRTVREFLVEALHTITQGLEAEGEILKERVWQATLKPGEAPPPKALWEEVDRHKGAMELAEELQPNLQHALQQAIADEELVDQALEHLQAPPQDYSPTMVTSLTVEDAEGCEVDCWISVEDLYGGPLEVIELFSDDGTTILEMTREEALRHMGHVTEPNPEIVPDDPPKPSELVFHDTGTTTLKSPEVAGEPESTEDDTNPAEGTEWLQGALDGATAFVPDKVSVLINGEFFELEYKYKTTQGQGELVWGLRHAGAPFNGPIPDRFVLHLGTERLEGRRVSTYGNKKVRFTLHRFTGSEQNKASEAEADSPSIFPGVFLEAELNGQRVKALGGEYQLAMLNDGLHEVTVEWGLNRIGTGTAVGPRECSEFSVGIKGNLFRAVVLEDGERLRFKLEPGEADFSANWAEGQRASVFHTEYHLEQLAKQEGGRVVWGLRTRTGDLPVSFRTDPVFVVKYMDHRFEANRVEGFDRLAFTISMELLPESDD